MCSYSLSFRITRPYGIFVGNDTKYSGLNLDIMRNQYFFYPFGRYFCHFVVVAKSNVTLKKIS